jgi:hypothetical protein
MSNTMNEIAAELAVAEGTFCGRNLANALRGAVDATEDEAYSAKLVDGTDLLVARWNASCEKYGWDSRMSETGWPAAVDAYYDRMTGKN